MIFEIEINNVQHLSHLSFSTDLSHNKLTCIVGKNGVGKTTLVRAISNLCSADIFKKTASPYIFNDNSSIVYNFNGQSITFSFSSKLNVIDTKQIIDPAIKKSIFVELPMPHGDRFNHFQKLGEIDGKRLTNHLIDIPRQ